MKTLRSFEPIGIILCLLIACKSVPTTLPQPTEAAQPEPQASTAVPQFQNVPADFDFSAKGLYHVGKKQMSLKDPNRAGHFVSITVWYPAKQKAGSTSILPTLNAPPDTSAAPYPLILSSTKMANTLGAYVVSHGFVWASVDVIDTYRKMDTQMFDQPLDILFTLDHVATSPPEGLESMIDADHAGVIGYSFDGYNTYALSGARIDPAYYLAQCPDPDATTAAVITELSAFNCDPANTWEEFSAKAGEAITISDDGMWQPMTDERIRAVIPMAGEGWWLFGERGLAAVDRPVLIIAGTADVLYAENVLIYEHLGTPDKTMISFIGADHMMMLSYLENVTRMAQFATAFFGYHLQEREDYSAYFAQAFVDQFEDLAWGSSP